MILFQQPKILSCMREIISLRDNKGGGLREDCSREMIGHSYDAEEQLEVVGGGGLGNRLKGLTAVERDKITGDMLNSAHPHQPPRLNKKKRRNGTQFMTE